jgi:hypothetical protein
MTQRKKKRKQIASEDAYQTNNRPAYLRKKDVTSNCKHLLLITGFNTMGSSCSVESTLPHTCTVVPPPTRLVCRRAKSFACIEDMAAVAPTVTTTVTTANTTTLITTDTATLTLTNTTITSPVLTTLPVRPMTIQIPVSPKSASRTRVSRASIQLVSPTAITIRQKHVVARIYTPALTSDQAHVLQVLAQPIAQCNRHTSSHAEAFLLEPNRSHNASDARTKTQSKSSTQSDSNSDSDEELELSQSMRNWSIDSTSSTMGVLLAPWENGPLLYPSERTILHMLKHRNSQAPQRLLDASTHKSSNALLYARFLRRTRSQQIRHIPPSSPSRNTIQSTQHEGHNPA